MLPGDVMIEIEIDGKKLEAEPNAMVIQVADAAGIYIPRFCYHKHLSVAANCRMCLVEVEKSPKALPACATPVMAGMKVFTRSPKALAAQKAVMEFLLINHPLDCPICDQGGECELQDLSMGYGSEESYYQEGKRSVKDKDIGPLVATEMTRCIHCTRCVRFGDEVAGFRELGGVGRGENTEIGTYITHAMHSEVSGNIIDLCPVGALTSKPFRFSARAWELQQFPTIAAHDCLGSNIYAHTRAGSVMRIVPRENQDINQTWISDRDRFSYEGLTHRDRLTKPLIRIENQWQETDWQTALEFAATQLQQTAINHGPTQIAALASPNSTIEEFYLLQKVLGGLGSSSIDHRLRQIDFSDQHNMPAFPGLNISIAELEECDTILLIGSNVQKEQPLISTRIRKASLKGANIFVMNMLDYDFHFKVTAKEIAAPQDFVHTLASLAKALCIDHIDLQQVEISDQAQMIADQLLRGKKVSILIGALAFNHPHAALIRSLANIIATQTHGTLGFLTEGANSAGAWLAGALPHRGLGDTRKPVGADIKAMMQKPHRAYVLLNVEPDLDCADPVAATNALEGADCVIALSIFKNAVLEQYASVILPIAPFTETSGTFVNVEGKWQSFRGVATSVGETRPAWKVLRVLGNLLHLEGFDFSSSEHVRDEVRSLIDEGSSLFSTEENIDLNLAKRTQEASLTRIGEIPLYATDAIVRRAPSLQSTQVIIEGNVSAVHMHPDTAQQLRVKETEPVVVKQHNHVVRLPVIFDERVPERAVLIAGGILATSSLGELFGAVEVSKV